MLPLSDLQIQGSGSDDASPSTSGPSNAGTSLRVIREDGYIIKEVGELYPHASPILGHRLNGKVLSEEGQNQAGAVAETPWSRSLAARLTQSSIQERRWPKVIRQLRLMDLPEYQHVEDVEMRNAMPIEFPSSQLLHELVF
jgi:hypothetical protein